jgi:leucyl/phenylalanyl-tRNA--protein transferase
MSKLPWLSETELHFPPVARALRDPDGLLAVGGDLRPERLVMAYEQGIFPWFQEEPILWWSPSTRMVLHPEELHVSRSMQKLLRQQHYKVTLDTAFARVIEQCALTREAYPGTWITPAMQQAYCQLHALSIAHSVEVWQEDELVGGLYGISMGQLFFGESMFSLRSNASKTALIWLTRQLQAWHFQLIDCQVPSEHLRSLGAREMSRTEFQLYLQRFREAPGHPGRWQMEITADEL